MLSISLATCILQIKNQLNQHLEINIKPFDMVIGAKGSPLQLVLSSVLHIDNPTGNILLKDALKISKNPMVKEVIPVSYGDNYKGYRILGTYDTYLKQYEAKLHEGKLFEKSFEVVLGSYAAQKLNLQLGSTLVSAHGLADNTLETHDEKPFTVVGILEPTGSVIDHLIITNLESIWEVHEHGDEKEHLEEHTEEHDDHEKHENEHDEEHDHHEQHEDEREITSLLVKFRNPLATLQLSRYINEQTSMQAALPKFEIERLMEFLGIGFQAINSIALIILIVAGLSIFINLIKTVRERKQELALLRTYGASSIQLLQLVFFEALFLSVFGFLLGWLLGRFGAWLLSFFTQDLYGYSFEFSLPDNRELLILFLVTLTTFLAAIIASLSIFKLNVSKTISNA
ncbi:putative ABC transport system permease protein [Aquimarina spongiae]|uniref:Putative ABC transport system permease protein n=2 Tax=Aquimarina spongiae TaxID=570521 RepID=A0A1M6KZ41_9FLAO|nr:putative ABC transport system permease protein [Aquimarina spongiae]